MTKFGQGKDFHHDPVYHHNEAWYFDDEAYNTHGPYETEDAAREELELYCERYL